MIKGVTFSGGDPFERAEEFSYMAKEFKKVGLNIWCYSGYTFEEIIKISRENQGFNDLINNIDVLVDGKFVEEEKDEEIKYRGSRNQRIIDVQDSIESGKIKVLKYD